MGKKVAMQSCLHFRLVTGSLLHCLVSHAINLGKGEQEVLQLTPVTGIFRVVVFNHTGEIY